MNKKSGTNGQPFVGCATRSTCTRNLGAIWILDCLYNDLRLTAEKSPFCLSQTSLIRTHWLRKVGRLVELEVKCEPWIMNASVLLLTAVACARNEQETMDKLRMSAFINLCVGCATLPLPYIVKVIWVRIWPIQWHAMAFWRATGNFFFLTERQLHMVSISRQGIWFWFVCPRPRCTAQPTPSLTALHMQINNPGSWVEYRKISPVRQHYFVQIS